MKVSSDSRLGRKLSERDVLIGSSARRLRRVKGASDRIVHRRGMTDASGLFFVGLTWQYTRGSALIGFVDDDAAFIAGRIDPHLENRAGRVGMDSEPT
jgi:hypothetical protein